jgi:hypothetical protein
LQYLRRVTVCQVRRFQNGVPEAESARIVGV